MGWVASGQVSVPVCALVSVFVIVWVSGEVNETTVEEQVDEWGLE